MHSRRIFSACHTSPASVPFIGNRQEFESLETRNLESVAPKVLKKFDNEISDSYSVSTEGAAGYISADGELQLKPKVHENMYQVFTRIDAAISIEKAYQEECGIRRLAEKQAAEEAEQKRLELELMEAARRAELERIQREKEEERRVQEMLAKKRAEQEAEKRERERLEQERLAMLEEKRRREEEERIRREAEECERAERERIAQEKHRFVRNLEKLPE